MVAAIEDVGVSLAPLRLVVEADGLGDLVERPLPAAVEVAVFRITVEALRNAARHASASSCVTMRRDSGRCVVEVSDDEDGVSGRCAESAGVFRCGSAPTGGVVTIESLVSGGTVVALELPVGGGDGDEGAPG